MKTPPPQPVEALLGGRYRLSGQIGAGGMGAVYEAHDELLRRRVAIKMLPAELQEDTVARERLRGEALAAAAIDHPFICKIHELGETDGRPFVVMEYVEGETLHALSGRGELPVRQIVEIATEVVEALDEAHRRGLVHRDLKPSNIMLTSQGHVKVMDFGLAKQVKTAPELATAAATPLTESGTRVGTPAYMSPEQVLGGPLDPRSDIFSLGVILHELATGRHPFTRDDSTLTMQAILRDPPATGARDLEALPGLGAVVGRMLAKACAERPQTMRELRVQLEGLRERVWASGSSDSGVVVSSASIERTPFVGRDAETGDLSRLLDRMLTGQGGCVLIGGEPGVGKTRLAGELMKAARQRGCLVLTGHCYEMEGAPPFVPFVEIIEEAVRLIPQAVRAALGDGAPEIASVVPSLRQAYADIPSMPELPADQRRRLVFNAVLEYVRRASMKSPAVLLFDDLHWADEPTLALFAHLAPHLASMRMLFLGTYRDVELDVGRPFARTLESLLRQRLATRIALRRMDEQGVVGMLAALGGSNPPSGLAHAVFQETEGNPFFVEEVYQHLDEEGRLFDANRRWRADLRVDTIEVPEGVRLVVGRRLDRLGEQAKKVLTAAAVIGRTFPLDVLEAVVDVSGDETLDAVEEAERAQLVAIQPGRRVVRYGFVHELIRTTLVGGLSLPRRQRLHLRIADALQKTRGGFGEAHASVLAHHLYQAGAAADVDRTAQALAVAGRATEAAGAFEETAETFENLLGLELPESDPLVAEASERRGNALAGMRRDDEAIESFARAVDLYRALGDDAGIARSTRMAADIQAWKARPEEYLAILHRGLDALSANAHSERARLLSRVAILVSSSNLDESWDRLEQAEALAERTGDTDLVGRVLSGKAMLQRSTCEYHASIATARRGLELVREDAPWERAELLVNLAISDYYLGRFADAEAVLPALEATAARAGHHGALWLHERVVSGMALGRTGDLKAYVQATELQARISPVFRYVTQTQLAVAQLYLGDEQGALDGLARVVEEQPSEHFLVGMPEGNLFAATALVGQVDRARSVVPRVERHLPQVGQRNIQGAFFALEAFAWGLALLGDRERCGALYPLAVLGVETEFRHSTFVVGTSGAFLAAAIAADAAGLIDKADEHFAAAARDAIEMPSRLLQPAVRYWHGRSLAGRTSTGDVERGRAMVTAALEDSRALGMVPHARLAERFLREGE